MFLIVVADNVKASIERVISKVGDVDGAGLASDKRLQLGLVEHGEP